MVFSSTAALVAVCALMAVASADPLPSLNVNTTAYTVSGLSAGAFFAVQYHVAFSGEVRGAGIVAGGPYYCSHGEETTALTTCMSFPEGINLEGLYAYTARQEALGSIDKTDNLKQARVFLYSGTKDTVVKSGSMEKLETYYKHYITSGSINSSFSVASEHGMPTLDYGNECGHLGEPFIQNCDYDGAGIILKQVLPKVAPAGTASKDNLLTFDQTPFGSDDALLYHEGYVYIPDGCKNNATQCSLHVVFHGCEQGPEFIGNTYAMHTGYNGYAESNNIVVLYPQVKKDILKENPNACFDWWGYADRDFATKKGKQMAVVKKMVDHLGGKASGARVVMA